MAAVLPFSPSALQCLAIVDRDVSGSSTVWAFPALSAEAEQIIKTHAGYNESGDAGSAGLLDPAFRYSRYNSQWYYLSTGALPSGRCFTVCLVSSSFDPLKFSQLGQLLVEIYSKENCSPVPVLQVYLSIFTTGAASYGGKKVFEDSSFDQRKSLLGPVKALIKGFGADFIHIWTACLLKKRILCYAQKLSDLQSIMRAFPSFVWHRQLSAFELLRPLVRFTELEKSELSKSGYYIAGTSEKAAVSGNYQDFYDLFVNFSTKTVEIPETQKNSFPLTKFHKQTAELLYSIVETPEATDSAVIKGIQQQNRLLFENIQALRVETPTGLFITPEGLKAANLPQNMENFIFAVAVAEGWTK